LHLYLSLMDSQRSQADKPAITFVTGNKKKYAHYCISLLLLLLIAIASVVLGLRKSLKYWVMTFLSAWFRTRSICRSCRANQRKCRRRSARLLRNECKALFL
jgi:hypothetical protein